MNRWKQNIFRRSLPGLAAVLILASVTLATGTALARYRTSHERQVNFTAGVPGGVYLGTMTTEPAESETTDPTTETAEPEVTKIFDSTAAGTWVQVEDALQLDFCVANGENEETFADRTQIFRIRLIGSMEAASVDALPVIRLIDPLVPLNPEEENAEPGYVAQAVQIADGSLLQTTFGDGWVFYFLDEEGKELTWKLEGGVFSCVELSAVIALGADTVIDTSLLQLQVLSEMAD